MRLPFGKWTKIQIFVRLPNGKWIDFHKRHWMKYVIDITFFMKQLISYSIDKELKKDELMQDVYDNEKRNKLQKI